jgi:hypothetical protein
MSHPSLLLLRCRYLGDCRHATRCPGAPARTTRGPNTPVHVTRGPGILTRATRGTNVTILTRAALAMTFGSRTGSSVYHPAAVAHDPRSTHPMVIRRAVVVTKFVDHLQLSTIAAPSTLFLIPTSIRSALVDPHWCHTMEEYEALLSNNTWDLVPRPLGANVITDKWIFKHKLKADNSLD